MLRNRRSQVVALLALLTLSCLPHSAWAQKGGKGGGKGGEGGSTQPTYTFTWLGTLGGTQSYVQGINNRGDIWGASTTTPTDEESRPFIIPGEGVFAGQMIDLYQVFVDAGYVIPFDWDTYTGVYTVAISDMNDSGQLVGSLLEIIDSVNRVYRHHTYVYRPESASPFVIIDDSYDVNPDTPRVRINNLGVVTSYSRDEQLAFTWTEETGLQYLEPFADSVSGPRAINASGVICGSSGSAWKYEPETGFSSLFANSSFSTSAMDINDVGQIVGTYQETRTSYYYGYRMAPDGAYSLFKMPKNNGSSFSFINNHGAVLGTGNINGSWRPILYSDPTGVVDLLRQTVNLPDGIYYPYVRVDGINDSGRIVGAVQAHQTLLGSSNLAFILTPNN